MLSRISPNWPSPWIVAPVWESLPWLSSCCLLSPHHYDSTDNDISIPASQCCHRVTPPSHGHWQWTTLDTPDIILRLLINCCQHLCPAWPDFDVWSFVTLKHWHLCPAWCAWHEPACSALQQSVPVQQWHCTGDCKCAQRLSSSAIKFQITSMGEQILLSLCIFMAIGKPL